jgi:polysaccharide lyase family 4-like protein
MSHDRVNVFNTDLGTHQWITKSLDEAGLYRLECDAHDWERGWVYAVENPYYDQTMDDGSFRISEVPPGRYTLVVWHEYTGEEPVPLTVTANGVVSVRVTLNR